MITSIRSIFPVIDTVILLVLNHGVDPVRPFRGLLQKWPDLIASEWHADGGLDAYAPASLTEGRKAKGLASSITGTLGKIKNDAKRAKENYQDLEVLIFVTPHKITISTGKEWAEQIHKEFGLTLFIISREDIITSLLLPSNASLCGTLPGIDVPIEQDAAAVLAKVRSAIAEEAGTWRARQRMADRPIVPLSAMRLDGTGKETSDTLDIPALRAALTESRRITLEAPGGGGKTTTLIQLATESTRDAGLVFLIDLPSWVRQGIDILEFIARARPFRAQNISAGDLARLAAYEHFSFLLNGWNEIAELHSGGAITALAELERSFPAAGILVATRTHYVSPPLPGAFRAKLLPFSRRQRASYLRQTLANQADDLRVQLEGSRVLDTLTRTPLILAEVVTIFQSGNPVPATRVGVLGAVMTLIEAAPEHRPHLQTPPLSNRADHYLTHLARHMTENGEVLIAEEGARAAIHSISTDLLTRGQIATVLNSDEILHALSAHHVLEQIDYPSVTFRFQHQQFQEFYAARFLANELAKLVHQSNDDADRAFAASYINMPMWEEPLRMVAEEIRLLSEHDATKKDDVDSGSHLITLALSVDPILASDLSRLAGPAVWDAVRNTVGKTLRDWYAVGERHHQQLALAAVLASGSSDFADILVPLLTDKDRQTRVSTYDAGDAFYPTSLGADWRQIVDNWDEDARADFVVEVTHRGFMADIGESFATTDPSVKVRHQAIQELSWISATDALTRVVNSLNDADLDAVFPAFISETIPDPLRSRFVAANRRLLAGEETSPARIRRLLRGIKLGDIHIATDLMAELTALSPPLDQYAPLAIVEALKIVRKQDPVWVSAWVTTKLLHGTLWGDHWQPFLLSVSPHLADDLIHQFATRELEHRYASPARMILSSEATPALAAKVFRTLCEVQESAAGVMQPLTWKCIYQLRGVFRAIPVETAVTGIISLLDQFDAITFHAVVDIFGEVNADAEELRSSIPDPLRQPLRHYLKNGIEKLLVADLFDDATRSHAAIALARIGDPEDLADLRRMIDSDIVRRRAKPNPTSYANWFVNALLMLAAPGTDAVLIDLLREQINQCWVYEDWAARGLLRLALPPNQDNRGWAML